MDKYTSFLPLITILLVLFFFGRFINRSVKNNKILHKSDPARPICSLTLIRAIDQTDYYRKYKVIIDSQLVGYISAGETKHYELLPGKHQIKLKIDWCSSKSHSFSITENSNTELQCGAKYNDIRSLVAVFFRPSNYLYVQ